MVSGRKLGEDSVVKKRLASSSPALPRGFFFIPRVRALPGRGPKSSKKGPAKAGH